MIKPVHETVIRNFKNVEKLLCDIRGLPLAALPVLGTPLGGRGMDVDMKMMCDALYV